MSSPGARGSHSIKLSGAMGLLALISAVVLITTLYADDGICGATKALVPQPNVGNIRINEVDKQ